MPAMCHCNMSRNYPFCDNSHKKVSPAGTIKQEQSESFDKPEEAVD
jgi:CDGSH-type Zn-finger protein